MPRASATPPLLVLLLLSVFSAAGLSLRASRSDTFSTGAVKPFSPDVSTTRGTQPVIIDTDIGSFIDDTFAIVFAALSQDLDVKLIVTCTDDTSARAKVTAKLLNIIGRSDIPIGIGIKNENKTAHSLFDWAVKEDLKNYKGGVYEDGIGKMAEVITSSPTMMDIIAIGPMTNFPMLIQKYPKSVNNSRIKAMAGSIYRGYFNSVVPAAEYNVAICPWCFEVLLNAGWNVVITPLDTCGTVRLDNQELQQVLEANLMSSLGLASSLLFYCLATTDEKCDLLKIGTPILYDAVATLLALPGAAEQFIEFKDMKLSVNDTGFTVEDQMSGVPVSVALSWKDQAKFTEYMTGILTQIHVP